ncbi:MAG: hypothetical protein ACR2M6_02410 [Vampirovibrionia bacterium]
MNDVVQLIRMTLLESSAVTNIVSSRVFSTHFIDYEEATANFPCVIIERQGGNARYADSMQSIRYHIYTYSKISTDEAMELYNHVYEQLHSTRLHIDGIDTKGYSIETSRPIEDYNMVCKGWYAKGNFLCYTA